MYGRLEEADPLVSSLCADKDPILRRSGMYTLAMAYCGTGNNQAIRKLLHVAVSFHKAKLFSLFRVPFCFFCSYTQNGTVNCKFSISFSLFSPI
ncbi:26S proteasome non-ATPase regulatory subunit 1 [Melipona quadrifasciata]|uniref:26S proteasome non-ATPase regulatory subunit 1 n=1 Tax=Melipona quadrifasciata TaxID=166423 RepID=A0A0N0BIW5_9HYME|nr:26S proteasome non-ATPase regulatory subunit 1 [Melipona quadrifasciata]